MTPVRLDLVAIERTLREVQREFPRINIQLRNIRDDLADEVVDNMLAGYEFVDWLVAREINPLAVANLRYMLDLNACVLFGRESRADAYQAYQTAAENQFYEEREGAIRDVVEWYRLNRDASPWKRAAGVYVRIVSVPQMFIEGNHRTGALIISCLLASAGEPPFVLTAENACAYFDPSGLIRNTNKHGLAALFRLPKVTRQFAAFLKEQANRDFLLHEPSADEGALQSMRRQ